MIPLVVYYSLTGTTKMIAELIADRIGADREEIVDLKKRNGPLSLMKNGAHASMRLKTKIQAPENDPARYDLVVLCTPAWAWNITPAVRTYIHQYREMLGKTVHVFTAGGAVSEKMFEQFARAAGEPFDRLGISAKDISSGEYRKKLEEFFKHIRPFLRSEKS